MSNKPLKELLNKSLSQEGPCLSPSLVTFNFLDGEICLFTVLNEGEALETALILDELAVQNRNLVYRYLHIALPLGEFNLKVPIEGVHD